MKEDKFSPSLFTKKVEKKDKISGDRGRRIGWRGLSFVKYFPPLGVKSSKK